MKVIVAGSRDSIPSDFVEAAISNCGFEISEIVSGDARGVDRIGASIGRKMNLPVKLFPADWDLYGKAAGSIRNEVMARYADALILIWTGSSSGSADMKAQMEVLRKPIYEVIVRKLT